MKHKLKTALWYLSKGYVEQFLRNVIIKLNYKKENTRKESTLWCNEVKIPFENALFQLAGNGVKLISFEKSYPSEIKNAENIVSKLPFKMGGAANLDLLYNIAELLGAKEILETGVACGWSSMALLLSLNNRNGTKLISTDMPYANLNNEAYVGCVVPDALRKIWTLYRGPDIVTLPKALKEVDYIDLCHYDSDKSYTGRMWAYPLLWNKIRKGGLFISDDINDNFAFKDFALKINKNPIVIEFNGKFIGFIRKD